MKYFLKTLTILPCLLFFTLSKANDGAFRAEGNQLIPMYETDVAVKKEILGIKRINSKQAEITVYYEFFNPKESKELEVGFEAYSPSGDVQVFPVNGRHPYITHFTVTLNGKALPFLVSIVRDSVYYKNGKYKSITMAQIDKDSEGADFFYVYHFRALFKPGLNIIQHTYVVDLSNSVVENYSLDYVLTAATRWANRQIDDFTFQVDMGEFQDMSIENTFFKTASDWKITGTGKSFDLKTSSGIDTNITTSEFYVRKGIIVFQKKDFKPKGEFHMHSFNYPYYYRARIDINDTTDLFDSKRDGLPFSIEEGDNLKVPADELSKKIEHNLPFARRGYIFKSKDLQDYFNRQKWYMPDSTYAPEVNRLTAKEQAWLKKN